MLIGNPNTHHCGKQKVLRQCLDQNRSFFAPKSVLRRVLDEKTGRPFIDLMPIVDYNQLKYAPANTFL
jgi:hypothetical protein